LLIQSEDIQDMINEFLFYKPETSPAVISIHASKRAIEILFQSEQYMLTHRGVFATQYSQFPVTQLQVSIARLYIMKGPFVLTAYNCQKCGEYYKKAKCYGGNTYYGKPIPKRIECICKREEIDMFRHLEYR